MRASELRAISLFDGLTDDQLAELADGGTEVRIEPGVDLFLEGEHADFWWVLVDGAIDLLRHIGPEDTVVGRMDVPGRWAGGFRAWDTDGVYLATGRGATGGRVLRVPAEVLREGINAWFPFGRHLIQGLYSTARSIEATARQRESLVTLGTLAAGFAHEINNPATAASRAVDALDDASQTLLSSLARLARDEISARQFAALDTLRREIEPHAVDQGPLALADYEEDLSLWLARHGVAREWAIAPPLAAAGVDLAWCERAATALAGSALEPGLEWVASTLSIAAVLSEMKDSTRRISELVAAIKSYSQMDRASMQQVDVTEGIESALVMLGYKLSGRITVVREYGASVPRIGAYPGELNQVWTNLIDNALDAMDGAGTLRLATRAEQDAIVVEVGDTGPGMAPQVASRAFDAFYTTKDAGRGTGLGLDIARRTVVERHGGIITIDSRPGKTVLRVRLPVRPPGLPGAVSRSGQVDQYDLRSRRRLRLLPLDRHRRSGQRSTHCSRLSGVTLAPDLAVLQYLRSDEDGRVDKCGEVQRVTGPRVDEHHPERAFDLSRRGVSTRHQTVDPNLADAPSQACEQRRNELVGHRAAPLHALEGGRQAERLGLADLDQEVTAPGHLVQHDTSDVMVIRLESDDLADPHLDEVDIHGRDHSGLLSQCIFYYHAIFDIRPTCSQASRPRAVAP